MADGNGPTHTLAEGLSVEDREAIQAILTCPMPEHIPDHLTYEQLAAVENSVQPAGRRQKIFHQAG